MNFFKRKFSFHEEDGEAALEDPSGAAAPSSGAPPSAFSFQAIANKVSSTISMTDSWLQNLADPAYPNFVTRPRTRALDNAAKSQ
ncbi:hypothetical protein ANCDUO_03238 [Ancylostoma duodenale]|uniref:Uncharacterized protein n=1 Tax=Ancylostoma duodenale TaxID=51022 RepID=A0A0C2DUF8_9BILA|nr:hypothetical protein ANCDUO_03238 [Ancylostoma duodenale]